MKLLQENFHASSQIALSCAHSRFTVLNRAKARPHRARPIGIEWLELRTLLANFNPVGFRAGRSATTTTVCAPPSSRANSSSGDDVITLQKGVYNLSITNSNGQENHAYEGDLDLTQSGRKVTIQGAGAGKSIIDAACIDRVFQIFDGVDRHLQESHHPQRAGAGRRHRRRATR